MDNTELDEYLGLISTPSAGHLDNEGRLPREHYDYEILNKIAGVIVTLKNLKDTGHDEEFIHMVGEKATNRILEISSSEEFRNKAETIISDTSLGKYLPKEEE